MKDIYDMLFNKRAKRTSDSATPYNDGAPDNPYIAARREWSERYGSYVSAANSWRMAAICAMGVSAIAVCGVVYIGSQSRFVPYVVEVNKFGDALASRRADIAMPPNSNEIQAALARWLTDVRTVYIDAGALRKNVIEAYGMTASGSPAADALNTMYRTLSPFDRAKNEVVTIEVEPPMPVTASTWRLEWRETVTPRDGNPPRTHMWAATVTFSMQPPKTEAAILANPTGIFVTQFSWAQRL